MKFNQLNKKHIIAGVLVIALCLGIAFVSCNRQKDADTSVSESTPSNTEEMILPSNETQEEQEDETNEEVESEEGTEVDPSENTPSEAPETSTAPSTSETKPSTSQPQSKPESSTAPSVTPQPSPEPTPEPSPEPAPQPSPEPSPEPPAAAAPTCSELFTTITSDGNERPSMQDVNDNMLSALYGIDASLLEDYCAKVPLMNVKVNEIVILKVKDSQNVSTVKAALQSRKDSVVQQFEQYLQDQLEIAQAGVVGTSGNYVYLIMDEHASSMESALISALK